MSMIKIKANSNYLIISLFILYSLFPTYTCSNVIRDSTINGKVITPYTLSIIPNMLITPSGNIFVTYEIDGDISLAVFDNGFKTIKAAFQATAISTNTQGGAALSVTPEGNIMMVWSSDHRAQSQFNVYYKTFSPVGDIVVADTQLSFYSDATATEQAVIKTANNMVIVWCHSIQSSNTSFGVEGVLMASDGQKQAITVSKTNPALYPTGIKLISLLNGFVAIYLKNVANGSEQNIFARIFTNNGQVTVDELIVNSTRGMSQGNPQVSALADGRFIVSWVNSNGLFVKVFDDSGNTSTTNDLLVCDCGANNVAGLSFGEFIIAYSRQATPQYYNSFFQIYNKNNNNKLIVETSINSQTTLTSYYDDPLVQTDSNDNIYFLYQSDDGIKVDKFTYNVALTCTDFTIFAKQSGYSIDFNGKISGDNGDPKLAVQVVNLPNKGTILDPITNTQAVALTDYSYLVFSINTSANTSFTYRASLGHNKSTGCKITVIACASGCDTCTKGGTDSKMNCDTCKANMHKKSDDTTNNNCYSEDQTIPGYKLKNKNKFEPCYQSCAQCSDIGNQTDHLCISCANSYYPLEDKPSNCYVKNANLPDYTFSINKFIRNKSCYISCATCSGTGTATNHMCQLCKTGYYNLEDNNTLCYLSTDNIVGYYFNRDVFSLCYNSCASCSTKGNSVDQVCNTCKANYYPKEDILTNCYINTDIFQGYYLDLTAKIFKKCYISCSKCTQTGDAFDNKCSSCAYGYSKVMDKPTYCLKSDQILPGYYLDSSNNTFTQCYISCKTCSAGGDNINHRCTACKDNYYPSGSNINCYDSTQPIEGYYIDPSKTNNSNTSTNNDMSNNSNTINNNTSNSSGSGSSSSATTTTTPTNTNASNSSSSNNNSNTNTNVASNSDNNNVLVQCYNSCYTCSKAGDDVIHNCLSCKIDYYPLEDNKTQCYLSNQEITGYKFDNNIYLKCDQACQQEQTTQKIIEELNTTTNNETLNETLNKLLAQPMSNDLIVNLANKLKVPDAATTPSNLESLNSIVDKYTQFIKSTNTTLSPEIFNVLDKVLDYTNKVQGNDQLIVNQYSKTKGTLQEMGSLYISTNLENPNLLVSTKNFEMDIFDYAKYDPNQELNWNSTRTSTIDMDDCAAKLKQTSGADKIPVSKLDFKTKTLSPSVRAINANITEVISSRQFNIDAYDPNTGTKLDVATLCKDSPADITIQANEYKDFDATEYNTYKRMGIDIYDKKNFSECSSFKNNESYADFTTHYINNITDVAIDCGSGCSYQSISNSKAIKCKCDNLFNNTDVSIFKQALVFSQETTKFGIIKCVGTVFQDAETIATNPSFWFIVTMVIFYAVVIGLRYHFQEFTKVFRHIVVFQINFKISDPLKTEQVSLKVNNGKETDMNTEKVENDDKLVEGEIAQKGGMGGGPGKTETDDKSHKEDNSETPGDEDGNNENSDNVEVQNDKQIDSYLKDEQSSEKDEANNKLEEDVITKTQTLDGDDLNYYRGKFLNVDINQGTADFCTTDELIKFDKRSYKKYLFDIFLTRHEVGKVFFFPDVFVPKFIIMLYFAQVTSVEFALNAILYDDQLINDRNTLKDNVKYNLII
jgi:hypothetical protein